MLFAFPVAVICLVIAWLWLVVLFLGPRSLLACVRRKQDQVTGDVAAQVIKREHEKLGDMS